MSPRSAATGLAANRIVFGLGLALSPARAGRSWIGARAAARPETQVFARALGARDVALGAGALRALIREDYELARLWLAGHALADGTDVLATLAARRHIPRASLAFALAVAAASTAVGAWSARAL